MLINVTIEQREPLKGCASAGQTRAISFVGWFELLRAVAELTEAADQSFEAAQPPPGEPGSGDTPNESSSIV